MFIWHQIFCLLFTIRLGSAIVTQQQEDNNINNDKSNKKLDCPNYQYKCPDCPSGTKCVYPNSGGCDGAGIPVCQSQSQFCGSAVCLIKAFPCSEECSFSCEYTGPKCCPFIGQPYCYVCDTFAPCQESSCPKDCPNDCFYPDADWCCPKSGTPICKNSDNSVELIPSTTTVTGKIATAGDKIYKRDVFTMPSSKWIQYGWFYQPTQTIVNAISSSTPTSSSWYYQSNTPSKSFDWFKQPLNQQEQQQATSSNSFKQPVRQQQEQATFLNWFKQPLNQYQEQDTSSDWFNQPVNKQQQQATSSNWFKQPVNKQQQQNTSSNWFKQPVNQQQQQATSSNWFKQPVNQQQQQEQTTSSNWFEQPMNQQQPSYVTSKTPLESSRAFYDNDNTQRKEREDKLEWFHQPTRNKASDNNGEVIMEKFIPSAGLIEENCSSACPDIPVPTWGTCVVYQNSDECCPRIECVGVPISFDPLQSSTAAVSSDSTHPPSNKDRND